MTVPSPTTNQLAEECACDPKRPPGRPWYAHQPGCPSRGSAEQTEDTLAEAHVYKEVYEARVAWLIAGDRSVSEPDIYAAALARLDAAENAVSALAASRGKEPEEQEREKQEIGSPDGSVVKHGASTEGAGDE